VKPLKHYRFGFDPWGLLLFLLILPVVELAADFTMRHLIFGVVILSTLDIKYINNVEILLNPH
jgi:hypothetical protein